MFCILSWRVFWLTMLNRVEPDLEPALVLTELETNILDHLIPNPIADPSPARTLSLYLIKIARLGGYLAPCQGPAARQHRHVARPLPVERHCPRGNPPD